MVQRCTKPNHRQYPNYGGRGIVVCEEWMPPAAIGYANFKRDVELLALKQRLSFEEVGGFDMTGEWYKRQGLESPTPKSLGPKVRWTLDRKDNSQGYNPDNVRWATYATQGRNRRGGVLNREYPIGVTWQEHRNKFKAYCTDNLVNKHLGYFDTLLDALAARKSWELSKNVEEDRRK